MSTKRIMLLGAGGQLGQALHAEHLPPDWELGAYSRAECDIAIHGRVQKTLQDFKPDLVINAAAMTNVDKCETEQDQAVAANFEGPANLAAQCAVLDVPLIHISTDFVFDGNDGNKPYKPGDPMNPLNVYGNTKMMGEESVRHEHAYHVILRISSVFSAFSNNMLTRALANIDQRDELKIVADKEDCPTYAPDIAKALIVMTNDILKGKSGLFGTFHLCGAPAVKRIEFTQAIIDAYAPFSARRPKILPAQSSDFPGFAPRPAYSVLDCAKIGEVYGITQKPWRDGLAEAINVLMKKKERGMTTKKGIILAGGSGTRLYPATRAVSKQLMPIHDKPMIYYPLSTLMLAGVRDILLISTPRDVPLFRGLLGDGSQWGIHIDYAEQSAPNGLAEAFIIGRTFIGKDNVAMILGDNLYYGHGLSVMLPKIARKKIGATVFGYRVSNPERYGVVMYDKKENPVDIVEKPKKSQSKWAVTGFYFYDNQVADIAKELKPSARGEIEITDINRAYLKQKQLDVVRLGRGYTWLDTGTHESLADATDFVRIIEQRQGLKIGCPEEIALGMDYINAERVLKIASEMGKTEYAEYLRDLVETESV